MSNIRIGSRIATLRKAKGITQEELANHLGVSKPAVSKWESGQSYPDILLLPLLAVYFDVTIDELMGYDPQMSKEGIEQLYHRLSEKFTKSPIDDVIEEIERYLKKYYSCWQLQFEMALLLVNHASLGSPDKMRWMVERALHIFERVEKEADQVVLARQAVALQAYCLLGLGDAMKAIDILESTKEPMLPSEPLLVKAYQVQGNMDKAMTYLQGYIYTNLTSMLSSSSDLFSIYQSDPIKFDRYVELYEDLGDLFQVKETQPLIFLEMYLNIAGGYGARGDEEKAMDYLEKSYDLFKKSDANKIQLKNNDLFDKLEDYIKIMNVSQKLPRKVETIKHDFVQLLLHSPVFESLKNNRRYQTLIKKCSAELI